MKRLFLGPGSLESSAYEKEILCPDEPEAVAPSIFLPGQLERVKEWRNEPWFGQLSASHQISGVISTTVNHAPTIAYHIKGAILFDGSIYIGNYRYPLHPDYDNSAFVSSIHTVDHLHNAALASTYLGTRFFAHWLADDCTRYLLAEGAHRVICTRRSTYPHQQEYQTYFKQDWTSLDRARINKLTIFQDFSQNSHKRKRYEVLRQRIKANVSAIGSDTRVYLRRGNTGTSRLIRNEDEIIDTLVKYGFVLVDVEKDTVDRIIGTLLGAKIVVSIEGSHNAHCTYSCQQGSAFLVLMPSDRFAQMTRGWAACLGIRYGFVVGIGEDAGYYFPVHEVLRTIDLLLDRA